MYMFPSPDSLQKPLDYSTPQTPYGSHSKTLSSKSRTLQPLLSAQCLHTRGLRCLCCLSIPKFCLYENLNPTIQKGHNEKENKSCAGSQGPGLPAEGSQWMTEWNSSEKLQEKVKEGYCLVLSLTQIQSLHSIYKRQMQ